MLISVNPVAFHLRILYNQDMSSDPYDPVHNPTCYKDWDAEKALQDAVASHTLQVESYVDQTRRHFEQAAPAAAMSIINIALYGSNERTKLTAAQYITDRMLGRIGEEKINAQDDLLKNFLADVVSTAEQIANGGTPS